jgi:hypothetical protein
VDENQRERLIQEYYSVAGFVQAYDGHSLSIKSWGLTVTGAAIGIGFSADLLDQASRIGVFGIAFILSVAFWLTEVEFKLMQQAHVYRQSVLEDSLHKDNYVETPAILSSYRGAYKTNRGRKRWRSVMFWPHVMMPHVLFTSLSLILIIYLTVIRFF